MNTNITISTYNLFASWCLFTVLGILIGILVLNDTDEATEGEAEGSAIYTVTAYCPCEICCGKWSDGHFANGQEVSFPAIAAPSNIPFGTKIHVPGYGVAKVKDRGGAIKGNKLGVYFPTHEQAKQWGKQELKCEVLK